MNFNDFNFDERLLEGLTSMGFKTPTPIQAQTIPLISQQHDLIACAQTGTGKTASYLLPIMDAICKMPDRPTISALILAPTRELAVQIDQQVEGLAYFTGITSIAVYGGGDGMGYEQQRRALREGVDLVIATPGRLIAHMGSGSVKLEAIRFLVLDEADRMLDMGFKDDILRIVRQLPEQRQTLLFSATMPQKIRAFAKVLLKNPSQVNIAVSKPAEKIKQLYYKVFDQQKLNLLKHILQGNEYKSIIIFCSTKEHVKLLDKELRSSDLKVKAFHSDLQQDEREQILLSFKNRRLNILVGTDVLSRGIDIEGIDLVVNYDVPSDPEDYIHRIGRTARAEHTGTAITFVNSRDFRKFIAIERLMDRSVEETPLPDFLGEGPHIVPTQKKKKKKIFKKRKSKGYDHPIKATTTSEDSKAS
ncbi:DEAD/DEAH box helicase [Olivibacter ginsenosidimutans]|uniref:DEAD/DEAH box helicase n=1 Tax=Olivibacter ginsenosidimutans TaxID=1176537 RepID=A0ABP9BFM1_9SPHI